MIPTINEKNREGRQPSTAQNTNCRTATSQGTNITTNQDCNANLDPLVTAEQVAKYFNVSSRAVLLWAAQGIIPHIRIGTKTVRFNMGAVRAAVEGGAA